MKQTIAFGLSMATLASAMPRQNEARQLQNLQLVCDGVPISTDVAGQPILPLPTSNPIGGVVSGISYVLPQPTAMPDINTLISRIVSEVLATATGAINPTAVTSIIGDVLPTDPAAILDPINSAASSIIAGLPTGGVSNPTAIIDPIVGAATSIIGDVLPQPTGGLPTAVIDPILSVASSVLGGLPVNPTGALDPTAIIDPILSVATSVIGGVIPEVTGAPLESAIGSLPGAVVSAVNSIIPPLESAVAGLPTSLIGNVIPLPTAAPVVSAIESLPSAVVSAVNSILPPLESAVAGLPTILPGTDGPACSLVPAVSAPGILEPVVSAVDAIITPLPSAVGSILAPVPGIVQPVVSAVTAIVAPVGTAVAGVVSPVASVVEGVVGGVVGGLLGGGAPAPPATSTLVPVVATPAPAVSTLLTVVSPVVPAPPAPTLAPRVPFCCSLLALGAVSSTCTVTTSAALCVGLKKFCVSASLTLVSFFSGLLLKLGLIVHRVPHTTSANLPASPPFWACFNLKQLKNERSLRWKSNFGIAIFFFDARQHRRVRFSIKRLPVLITLSFLTCCTHSSFLVLQIQINWCIFPVSSSYTKHEFQ
jgi:hypothetical protein